MVTFPVFITVKLYVIVSPASAMLLLLVSLNTAVFLSSSEAQTDIGKIVISCSAIASPQPPVPTTVYFTIAFPSEMAVNTPVLGSIEAIAALLEDQVPPD